MVFLERIFRMNHLTPTIQRAGQEGQERRYAKCERSQRPKNIGAALTGQFVDDPCGEVNSNIRAESAECRVKGGNGEGSAAAETADVLKRSPVNAQSFPQCDLIRVILHQNLSLPDNNVPGCETGWRSRRPGRVVLRGFLPRRWRRPSEKESGHRIG